MIDMNEHVSKLGAEFLDLAQRPSGDAFDDGDNAGMFTAGMLIQEAVENSDVDTLVGRLGKLVSEAAAARKRAHGEFGLNSNEMKYAEGYEQALASSRSILSDEMVRIRHAIQVASRA